MNKNLIALAIAVFVLAGAFSLRNIDKSEDNVHLHAGFLVYIDNELQDFSDFKYMNFKSCGEHIEEMSPEEEQIEKAHLHDFIGDVVHVHRENATWGDLFKNISFSLFPTEVYINGDLFEGDFLSYEIKPYDSVVIFQGEASEKEEKINARVTKGHILEVEQMSEYCAI